MNGLLIVGNLHDEDQPSLIDLARSFAHGINATVVLSKGEHVEILSDEHDSDELQSLWDTYQSDAASSPPRERAAEPIISDPRTLAIRVAVHHLHRAAGVLADDFPEQAQVISDIIADLQSQAENQ